MAAELNDKFDRVVKFSLNFFFDQDRKKLIAYAIARADDSTYVIPSLSRQFE